MASSPRNDLRAQRRRVLITAWVLAAVAAGIFVAFVMSGVLKA